MLATALAANARIDQTAVRFEPHEQLSEHDKGDLIRLTMIDILADPRKAQFLDQPNRIVFKVDGPKSQLPSISNIEFLSLDDLELKELAEKEGELRYFTVKRLTLKGSSAIVTFSLKSV